VSGLHRVFFFIHILFRRTLLLCCRGLLVAEGTEFEAGRAKTFLVFTSSRPVLRPTQPPIQDVPGALSPGVKR
jgi:hypothetical protein